MTTPKLTAERQPLVICDKYGWPVEYFKGKPIKSLIRFLIHGRKLRRGCVQRPDAPGGPTCWKPTEGEGQQ